jgi:predicted nuclease with RNAse H fold
VAPLEPPRNGWIAVGLRVFRALAAAGLRPIEVFPQAAFRVLAGGAVPPKTRPEGLAARAELLRAEVDEPSLSLWGHDGLDALVAAVVARDHAAGVAARVGCGHDASAIWLPGERRRGGAGGSDASP